MFLMDVRSGVLCWSRPAPPPLSSESTFTLSWLCGRGQRSWHIVKWVEDDSQDVPAKLGLHVSNVSHILFHLNLILPIPHSHVIVVLEVADALHRSRLLVDDDE